MNESRAYCKRGGRFNDCFTVRYRRRRPDRLGGPYFRPSAAGIPMSATVHYPLSAVVAADELKLALCLAGVDP
ncbi:hypothetical protein, partial [Pseudomonas aeruginosa]|uniref:hypothetical protein n=3 Tax=Pseudomonas aeruginosa TaxID=287 RepID=UPI001C0EE4A6